MTGDTYTLFYSVEPSDLGEVTLSWTSSDESVAVVENGEVKAVGAGNTDITLSSKNGKQDTCKISVREPILPETIGLSDNSIVLFVDDKYVIDLLNIWFNRQYPYMFLWVLYPLLGF